jgi:DNA polymerase-3 subunit alpha
MFAEGFQEYRHLIEEHAIRVISGKIRYDDFIGGWRVQVKTVKDIDRVIEQRASHLTIHWMDAEKSGISSDGLRELLAPFRPGRCAVELWYSNADAQARLPLGGDWQVRPSGELRDKLAESVGIHAFKFDYEKRSASG